MEIAGLILFIVCTLATLGLFAFGVYTSVKANKDNKIISVDYKKITKKILIISIGVAGVLAASLLSIHLWLTHEPEVYEWIATTIGGALVGFLASVSLNFFILHYYGKGIEEKVDKWLFRGLCIAFPLLIVSLFFMLDGFANYLTYPLVNELNFTKGFLRPYESGGGMSITFYALSILSGAVFVYFLCDHKFYQQYGEHGILESTFFVAFPSGIIGARLFYVLGQWNDFFPINATNHLWYKPFAVWEGGLTILGGAVCGIIAGCLWFKFHKKKYSLRLAADIIVPTILIAQAVGRWGNFFNCEVHGVLVSEEYFAWLPRIIYNNIHFGLGTGAAAIEGHVFVPLFLIEGLINMLGYFVLGHLFGVKLRKHTELGDLAYGYIIWYGMTRAILEPMRHEKFIMTDLWSWYWALVFVFVGTVLIVGNHVVEYLKAYKKNEVVVKASWRKGALTEIIIVALISIALLVNGIVTMVTAPNHEFVLPSSQFNVGFIFVVCGVSFLITIIIPIIHYVEVFKEKYKVEESE